MSKNQLGAASELIRSGASATVQDENGTAPIDLTTDEDMLDTLAAG